MLMDLKPGMRLKTKNGQDVEILKTDFNCSYNSKTVLAVVTDATGRQVTRLYTPEGCNSEAARGDNPYDLVGPYDELKDGDPVFVRQHENGVWFKRHFFRLDARVGRTPFLCYPHGQTRWTVDLANESGIAWAMLRIPTEDELKTGEPK